MSNKMKHADVIVHMAQNGFNSVEGFDPKYHFWLTATDVNNPTTCPSWEWRIKSTEVEYKVKVELPMQVKPEHGEGYWYINHDGVDFSYWDGGLFDNKLFNTGNIWDSKDKAQAAMLHDYPILQQFHTKHALGSIRAPSCFCCGKQTDPVTRPVAVKHLELPSMVICQECKTASQEPCPDSRFFRALRLQPARNANVTRSMFCFRRSDLICAPMSASNSSTVVVVIFKGFH